MLKKLLGSPAVQFLIGKTIGYFMLFVGATTRWTYVNRAGVERLWAEKKGLICAIWHGRFVLVHTLWKFDGTVQPPTFLISGSREGGVAAVVSRTVGADVVRGSSAKGKKRKGGFEAMLEMKRHIEEGGVIGMTPDGPRGPRMRARHGAVRLAMMSGAPILPIAWSTRWRILLAQTWDRFVLPLPFGRGVLVWGEPIYVARNADDDAIEAARLALENELQRITALADRMCGRPAVEPAPPRDALEPAAAE